MFFLPHKMVRLTLVCTALFAWIRGVEADDERHYAISLYGPKGVFLEAEEPFPYVNPEAPKGGRLIMDSRNFTTLNPYSLKGIPNQLLSLIFETPTVHSYMEEESFTEYGHLVSAIVLAEDRMSLTYTIREEAHFSDGEPVTADDFVFSFELTAHPEYHPFYKQYFSDVKRAVKIDRHTVRFEFRTLNQELPLIVGQLPILPKHIYGAPDTDFGRDFDEVAIGSGPYMIEDYDFGGFLTVRRNPDWWALHLPRTRGMYNFDRITARVYRDDVARNEAFKGGQFDVLYVNAAKDWAMDFDGPFVQRNYILRQEIPHDRPVGMQGFAMNLRNPVFQSHKTRYAIAMAFDFPWTNQNLFYGQYTRTHCFFENSPDMTNREPPEGRMLEYLTELRERHGPEAVPKMAIEQPLRAPGHGNSAGQNLQLAEILLEAAGWQEGQDGIRVRNGRKLEFTLLLNSPNWVRISEPYKNRLRRLGAKMNIEVAQPADYQNRVRAFQYGMITQVYSHSRSIGNEQRDAFGSEAADVEGSRNVNGLKNPAADEIMNHLVAAESREELVFYGQALDRILTSSTIIVPHWHLKYDRLLAWNKFGRPDNHCTQLLAPYVVRDHWWFDSEKADLLRKRMADGDPIEP